MKTTTFDLMKIQAIELAVCKEFECEIRDLVSVTDTFQKKVVVFLLMQHGFDKRMIGHKYQITYLYVPTVVEETKRMMQIIPAFKEKINSIIKSLTYEKVLDTHRIGYCSAVIS
jgi:hypothetical protein